MVCLKKSHRNGPHYLMRLSRFGKSGQTAPLGGTRAEDRDEQLRGGVGRNGQGPRSEALAARVESVQCEALDRQARVRRQHAPADVLHSARQSAVVQRHVQHRRAPHSRDLEEKKNDSSRERESARARAHSKKTTRFG